ncbi:hypothetical protein Goarm_022320 [Gossypium armourianum]|uniref:Uncharacterized protein n=1 Tax=Gossypium armourianum TaxID=34283 RepID=A0A7J9KGS5_9ROSI|nr:hypothetical protein [Gossypium armourianum]
MAAFQGLRFGFAEGTQFLSMSTIKQTLLFPSTGRALRIQLMVRIIQFSQGETSLTI